MDGTVELIAVGDSLQNVIHDWNASSSASYTAIRSRIHVVYDPMSRDELNGNAGTDWFWTNDALDRTDRQSNEQRN